MTPSFKLILSALPACTGSGGSTFLSTAAATFYSTSVSEESMGGGRFLGVGRVVAVVCLMVVRVAATTNEESTWKQLEACIITMIHFLQLARANSCLCAGPLVISFSIPDVLFFARNTESFNGSPTGAICPYYPSIYNT